MTRHFEVRDVYDAAGSFWRLGFVTIEWVVNPVRLDDIPAQARGFALAHADVFCRRIFHGFGSGELQEVVLIATLAGFCFRGLGDMGNEMDVRRFCRSYGFNFEVLAILMAFVIKGAVERSGLLVGATRPDGRHFVLRDSCEGAH